MVTVQEYDRIHEHVDPPNTAGELDPESTKQNYPPEPMSRKRSVLFYVVHAACGAEPTPQHMHMHDYTYMNKHTCAVAGGNASCAVQEITIS